MNTHRLLSRRNLFSATALAAFWLSVSSCSSTHQCETCASGGAVSVVSAPSVAPVESAAPALVEAEVKSPAEALQRLMEGNKRFVAFGLKKPNTNEGRRQELGKGQHPFATIFACVDSRVPPEVIFDRGLGDLFVARTAGQVLDRAVMGSIQYGVGHVHTPLLFVLGHSSCGAVTATIEALESHGHAEGDIGALVDGIKPAVEKAKTQGGDLLDKAVRTNVEMTVERLKNSPVISEALKKGELKVAGGVYNLNTGVVELTVP